MRGADRGVDGLVYFVDGPRRTPHNAVIQVKGGRVAPSQMRDLKGVVGREKVALGLFISLEEPTREMRSEAARGASFTRTPGTGIFRPSSYAQSRRC